MRQRQDFRRIGLLVPSSSSAQERDFCKVDALHEIKSSLIPQPGPAARWPGAMVANTKVRTTSACAAP
jgi:hypothetical protein